MTVKKSLWIALILMLVCIFSFSACDQGDTPPANDDVCQHAFGNWNTTKQATCKDEGELVRVCSKCSAEEKTTVAKTNVHTEVIDAAISATCETTGLTEGKHCSVCGVVTVEQTTLPLASHTYDNDEDSRCNICDYVRNLNCQHTETEVLKAVTPTCTASGLSEGAKCSSCGEIIVAQISIPAKEHTPTTTAGYDATCTQTGLSDSKKCSVCGTELEKAIVIPIKPHEYTDKYDKSCNNCDFVRDEECAHTETITIEGKNATCTELGLTDGIKCTECGEILIAQTTVGALGHIDVTDAAVAPTCTETGLTEGKHCSRCNTTLVAQTTVGALGHIEVIDSAVAPTCTETGLTEGKHCSRCSSTLVAQTTVDALGHTEIWVVDVEATCKESGKKHKECGVCNEILETITIDKLTTHTPMDAIQENITNSTCLENGSCDKVVYCSLCKQELSRETQTIEKGHLFVDGRCQKCNGLESSKGLNFKLNADNESYSLVSIGTCTDKSIVIDYYNNLPVTTINYRAFKNNTKIENVILGNSVVTIHTEAFYGCSNLKEILIPDSVTSVAYWAFAYCTNVNNIEIGKGLTKFDNCVFRGCSNIEKLTVSDENTNYYSENNCIIQKSNKSIILGCKNSIIPNNVVIIGESSFELCSDLDSIVIPSGITKIEAYAFSNCSNLEEVQLPATLKSIGGYAFNNCAKLSEVVIPNNVTSIGYSSFSGCSTLNSITLPFLGYSEYDSSDTRHYHPLGYLFGITEFSNAKATSSKYYPGTESSEKYYIPYSLKSVVVTGNAALPYGAFYGCSMLTNITLSGNITEIGSYSFAGCSGIKNIVLPQSVQKIDSWAFYKSGIISIIIPNEVNSIGARAFDNCSKLTEVTIGSGVKSIGIYAFANCTNLASVAFVITSGWGYSINEASDTNSLSSTQLSDAAIAASWLTEQYSAYLWTKD